jgi:murein hydrolase activator
LAKVVYRLLCVLALATASFLATAQPVELDINATLATLTADVVDLKDRTLMLQSTQRQLDHSSRSTFSNQAITALTLQRLALHPKQPLFNSKSSPVEEARRKAILAAALPSLLSTAQGKKLEQEKLEAQRSHLLLALIDTRKSLAEVELFVDTHRPESGFSQEEVGYAKTALTSLDEELISIEGLLEQPNDVSLTTLVLPQPQPSRLNAIETLRPETANLSKPVALDVIAKFGDADEQLGTTAKGVYLKTDAQASVVSPQKGLVTFAGDFRGYGKIVIVEHDATHHSVLSGLANLSVNKGEWVRRGQILGYMGTGATKATQLYYELRIQGVPVDPLPWLNG